MRSVRRSFQSATSTPLVVSGLAVVLFVAALVLAACTGGNSSSTTLGTSAPPSEAPSSSSPAAVPTTASQGTEAPSGQLVIYSARSEPLLKPVIDAFVAQHPQVQVALKTGKNGELANALLEERGSPQADLFITTELFTIQALAQQGVLQSYASPRLDGIPVKYRGPDDLWTGLTLRARVIMYNTTLVAPEEVPKSIFALTEPKWKGKIAAADSTNGSMQAHIAALRVLLGDEATQAWVRGLVENGTVFFGGHTDVRKAVAAGEFALGLVNHYYYHLQKAEGGPVGVVYPDQEEGQIGLLTNATAVGLVKGGRNARAAQAFVDFLLSPAGQKLFAELNYEYPLLEGVPLHPEVLPLRDFRLADVDVQAVTGDLEGTFAIIEAAGMK